MSLHDHWAAGRSWRFADYSGATLSRLIDEARSAGPPLLFGLRVWAAVCLTLYVTFWLELDKPFWAATTTVIVCQPSLGASLRKASFRMIGTLVGAVAIIAITAAFPQSRVGFLLGLALWGALCGLFASVLQNFAAYAAALAGYTAAIIAMDQLGSTGGAHGDILMLAINRASEICIGIVCAGLVLAGTDFGHARRRLAARFAGILVAVGGGFSRIFVTKRQDLPKERTVRRELIRQVAGLSPAIDEATGESSELRYRLRALQAAVDGLFAALVGWRAIANHFEQTSDRNVRETQGVLQRLPDELRGAGAPGTTARWMVNPLKLQHACRTAARNLVAAKAATPSEQMIVDHAARALRGLARAFDGLALLTNPTGAVRRSPLAHFRVPDWMPSIVNALRVVVTIGAAELFWILTAWPSGATAITFAAIIVILLSPQQDNAYVAARTFLFGTLLSAAIAAIVAFAVLPQFVTFVGFSLVLGAVLVPLGALSAGPWNPQLFTAAAINFIPMLGPQNQMAYNTHQFYNSAAAICIGILFAVIALRLIPPLSPALRTHRLLALTLRDLRKLAGGRTPMPQQEWESRIYGRLAVLPQQAELVQGAQLAAALSVGAEVIRLRNVAGRFGLNEEMAAAFVALAAGNSAQAARRFAEADRALASIPEQQPGAALRLRARGSICAITEALARYSDYFDAGAAR